MNLNREKVVMNSKLAAAAVGVVLLAVAGAGVAVAATGDDGDEGRASGPQARKAVAAALQLTGGGRANAVERDTEKGATWEVEVTRPDGVTVDVRLDADYGLVAIDRDTEDSRR